jgi:hypothetical protein
MLSMTAGVLSVGTEFTAFAISCGILRPGD